MSSFIITQAIDFLASIIIGTDAFNHVKGAVDRWGQKQVDNASKTAGVKQELVVLGVNLTESLTNLAIELAVTYLKAQSGNIGQGTTNTPSTGG
jgi:hypothetical protein